jgi:hypothetical protein
MHFLKCKKIISNDDKLFKSLIPFLVERIDNLDKIKHFHFSFCSNFIGIVTRISY